jgi:hypothetical protein
MDNTTIVYNDLSRALVGVDTLPADSLKLLAVRVGAAAQNYSDSDETPVQNAENAVLRAYYEYVMWVIAEKVGVCHVLVS